MTVLMLATIGLIVLATCAYRGAKAYAEEIEAARAKHDVDSLFEIMKFVPFGTKQPSDDYKEKQWTSLRPSRN